MGRRWPSWNRANGWLGVACLVWAVLHRHTLADTPTELEFFELRIRPVLVEHCYECHSAEAADRDKLRGGLRLDTAAGLRQGGDSGAAIVEGDPAQSLLIAALRHDGIEMPPSAKLDDAIIADFESWIRSGAVDPRGGALPPAPKTIDLSAAERHWSFQPLDTPPLPAVTNRCWPRVRTDRFILKQLEDLTLTPSPTTDARTLVKRIYMDLTGLPPEPEQIEQFASATVPNAYADLVDRLLASPAFGERWGRVWLDCARYADEIEAWLELAGRPHLYRNWVIGAWNQDLPYDRFLTLQLAADLCLNQSPREGSPADLAALGFLGLGPRYWKELRLAPSVIRKIVADEWDERVDAVSRTFMGLTVSCARCHDHKFDPISMEDYYALAGIFASTQHVDRPLIDAAQWPRYEAGRQQIATLEQQIKQLQDNPKASTTDIDALRKQIEQLRQADPTLAAPLASVVIDAALFVVADGPDQTRLEVREHESRNLPIFVRGNPENQGPVVPHRFIRFLSHDQTCEFTEGSGRLELAHAMLSDASGLVARVMVNRVWHQLVGRGIVTTPSNFGLNGDAPSHPELLDDLAARFVNHDWSLKWLIREIVLSATYQQSSDDRPSARQRDPDNRWVWRMNRRRLSVEAWRDKLLAVSGTLSRERGSEARPIDATDNRYRTVYSTVNRREPHVMLQLYDFPSADTHSPQRLPTYSPLQQLVVLNSDFVLQQSAAFAQRARRGMEGRTEAGVRNAYRLAFGRQPTPAELSVGLAYLQPASDSVEAAEACWREYAQILLATNEFMFLD